MSAEMERAAANFEAAKEICRIGHADEHGQTCTYGGMAAANGYWLAAETCPYNHGETCDLRAVCDGAEAETGFIGRDGMMLVDDWIWRVTACRPCADVWIEAHPEWKRPDPDAPQPTLEEISAQIKAETEAARARMNPVQRAVADEMDERMTNLLLYGQHPAPDNPPTGEYSGFAGLFGDAVTLIPPARNCYLHENGTWIHLGVRRQGHTCPKWARG